MTRLPIKQTGQSMTQYIIILALVAVSAVTLFSAFGGVNRAQVSAVANEIAGNQQGAEDSIQLAQNYARYASDSASYSNSMGNYNSSPDWSNYSGGGSSGTGSSGTGNSGTGNSGTGNSGTGNSEEEENLLVSSLDIKPLPSPARGPAGSPTKVTLPNKSVILIKTGLGTEVDKLISKSPTLVDQLNKLDNLGWTIKYGKKGGIGAYAARDKTLISLPEADKNNPASIVQSLAHEVGHALYSRDPYIRSYGKLTKKEYVDKSVIIDLKDEGEATMNNIRIQREIMQKTEVKDKNGKVVKKGIDIKIAGGALGDNSKNYNAVYDLYLKGEIKSLDIAREKVGRIFANHEQPSHEPGEKEYKTYFQYYQSVYIEAWDKDHAKK